MDALKVCVVGCGAVTADLHAPVLEMLERRGAARVIALVDSQAARAQALARGFRRARVFSSMAESFKAQVPDLVFVASPPGLHFEHILEALAAGCHVFVEKPMVTRPADAERVVAASAAAGRFVAVGLPRRYYPHTAVVGARIAAGDLGDDVTFTFREGGPFDWPVASGAVFDRAKSGGGVLMDKGVHSLDVLDQLFGPVTVVRCRDDSLKGGVEANAVLDLAYAGARGSLHLSWDQAVNNGIWVRGSLAEAYLGHGEIDVYRWRPAGGAWKAVRAVKAWAAGTGPSPKTLSPVSYYDCITLQWWGVVRAITQGEPPAVDAARATRVIAALDRAYSVAENLDLPWLTAPEREQAERSHWRAGA